MIDLSLASPTLMHRVLGKIVNAGPATPCATWVGGYNAVGKNAARWGSRHQRRPMLRLGPKSAPMVYIAPLVLTLAGRVPEREDQTQACHRCPTGAAWHGLYSCVDVDHLRWGNQSENEQDKWR